MLSLIWHTYGSVMGNDQSTKAFNGSSLCQLIIGSRATAPKACSTQSLGAVESSRMGKNIGILMEKPMEHQRKAMDNNGNKHKKNRKKHEE